MGAPPDDHATPSSQPNLDDQPSYDAFLAEDLSLIMPEDASEVYAPPPHLAARFYRNRANLRRKSSAASSRRNSLSSAHSQASSLSMSRRRSSAPGAQSNYVAQHLRRASIIESRKARLADRAAHVEQVRLRAALVKAAPRVSSTSEERALAAQLAKERYLAKVAAACAEEVARAKRIAEEVKGRKLAEEARARLEMEERHAEVEKRRAEFQRNLHIRRVRRAESAEKKLAVVDEITLVEEVEENEEAVVDEEEVEEPMVLDEETASRKIQRAWRVSGRRGVMNAFVKLELSVRQAASKDFDDMTVFIASPHVIHTTTALLMLLGLQQANDENAALNTRTFLSAYILIGHPIAVLNNKNGTQEQDLIAKANELASNFETTLSRLAPWNNYTASPTQLETLSQSYSAYTSAFAAWRLQDSSVLIEGMVASFVELDAIWQTVKDDTRGEVASDYREGIRDSQVRLLSRIQKLAGRDRADVLIKKAIRESRRRRPKKRAVAEVRPRVVETSTEASSSSTDVTMVPSIPHQPDDEDDEMPQQSGELNRLFTTMPSNRALTHELAIDKDYRLEEDKENAALRDQIYRAICDNMKLGFEAGHGAVWTVSAAENLREKLLRMLKPGNSLHQVICENLDLELIGKECRAGVFSYDGFFAFMAKILPKLCAPFRDQEVKVLTDELLGIKTTTASGSDNSNAIVGGDELSIMIEKLFKLLRMVDKLSLDYSNFMLMNAAPTLIRESAGYEQRAFAKDLESGTMSLERTRRIWHACRTTLEAEADRRDNLTVRRLEDVRRLEGHFNPYQIYAKLLVDLAISQDPLTNDDVPETLSLDITRLQRIRSESLRIAVIGAIFLTAKNLLRRDIRAQWKAEAARLWTLLATEGYGQEAESKAITLLASAHNMPASTRSHLSSAINRFFSQAAMHRLADPVLKVLFQRLRAHIHARLAAASAAERVRAAATASEALASCGLAEFATQVGGIVDLLERVRGVDWSSHGVWYEQVAGEQEEE